MHKVLVIDNHDETRNTLAGVLTLEGFKTTQANTGQSGVALAIAERPDLVLLGMHLRDIFRQGDVHFLLSGLMIAMRLVVWRSAPLPAPAPVGSPVATPSREVGDAAR